MLDPHTEAIKKTMRTLADTRCLAVLRALGDGPATLHELIEACWGDAGGAKRAVQRLHKQCLIEACDDQYVLSGRVRVQADDECFFISVKVAGSCGISIKLAARPEDSWSDQAT